MDLTDAILWAGQAAVHGTDANRVVQAGLRSILHVTGEIVVTNPVSSARDGSTPDLTRVLLCDVQVGGKAQTLCVKLYPPSSSGQVALDRHARLLQQLRNTVPVPDVVAVLAKPDALGFPALVTTSLGQPLDLVIRRASVEMQGRFVVRVAEAVAALHACDPSDLPIDSTYEPDSIRRLWQEDANWYKEHASAAGESAALVLAGAAVLADHCDAPSRGSVLHRDVNPYNILATDGAFVTLIDWDHAGFAAPQEDVGKTLIGFLSMLSTPRSSRLTLARTFLDAYSHLRGLPRRELFLQSLPFALDTLLDWVVGGKNAPQDELSWATERILSNECV